VSLLSIRFSVAYDSSYWNFRGDGVPEDHSYVRAAADAGYTTFRYDRLGTGFSDHPDSTYEWADHHNHSRRAQADGWDSVVQAATDVAIATQFAKLLRQGKIGGKTFSKIVSVGHSYGSIQTNALTQTPGLVDHAVLTGFTANTSSFALHLGSAAYTPARAVFPARFGSQSNLSLAHGYLVSGLPQTSQMNFLFYPFYPTAAALLARKTEQPVTQGVLFTFSSIPGPAPGFTGSVAVVTGQTDFIFCSVCFYPYQDDFNDWTGFYSLG
jgi:pimeloyl-ACP methyl ester carboxylesterase